MAKRRIKKARVKFLSLCPRGANKLPVIYKDDGAFQVRLLTKGEMTEQGEVLAVVYAPEFRDSQGDIASAEVIKDMLYAAAKDGWSIDMRHNEKALDKDAVYAAEQFLVQKGDPRFDGFKDYDGNPVDVTGAWAVVLKVEDENLRALYREGKWAGVSLGGVAEFEDEKDASDDDVASKTMRVVDALAKRLGVDRPDNEEEADVALSDQDIEKLATAVTKAVTTAITPPKAGDTPPKAGDTPPKADEKTALPVFKGDPTDKAAVAAHLRELNKASLMAKVDWSDPEQVAKVHEQLAALDAASQESKSPEVVQAEAALAKAQGELARLRGRSQQPAGTPPTNGSVTVPDSFMFFPLTKEEEEDTQIGLEMAKIANDLRKPRF